MINGFFIVVMDVYIKFLTDIPISNYVTNDNGLLEITNDNLFVQNNNEILNFVINEIIFI